ncbi:hypothetical protein ABZX74_46660 [Streptomyces olivaceoviridis]|uniref:scabin-related ADP-ribosyltransferase n=1 Tax=Streptomyces olivaceoviridis TaxID=1921 RepID=UPI0033A348C6
MQAPAGLGRDAVEAEGGPQVPDRVRLGRAVEAAVETHRRAWPRVVGGPVEGDRLSLSAFELSQQRCLTFLQSLREALYPQGVVPARVVDDSVLDGHPQRGGLVPGAEWQPVAEWDEVVRALTREATGPGSTAFVLAGHPQRIGHALAAHALSTPGAEGSTGGGGARVVWVDLSGEGSDETVRVSDSPPGITPAQARVVVVDSIGRVVADVMPAHHPSPTMAAALVDPSPSRQHGAGRRLPLPPLPGIGTAGSSRPLTPRLRPEGVGGSGGALPQNVTPERSKVRGKPTGVDHAADVASVSSDGTATSATVRADSAGSSLPAMPEYFLGRNVQIVESSDHLRDMPGVATAATPASSENISGNYTAVTSVPWSQLSVSENGQKPRYRTDGSLLFRWEAARGVGGNDHEQIFRDGFRPRSGNVIPLRSHVFDHYPSIFVSTTRDHTAQHSNWGTRFRYLIDAPGGIDVNASLLAGLTNEGEIAFPGGIRNHLIVGVEIVNGTPLDAVTGRYDRPVDFIPNPYYFPQHRIRAAGNIWRGEAGETWVDTSGWEKLSDRLGSNPGGVYRDSAGHRFYVKQAPSADHARNEVLAATLYRMAGVEVPRLALVLINGAPGTASPFLPGAQNDLLERKREELYRKKVQAGFAVDAWLANRDVAGQLYDNILTWNSYPVRVDFGGALLFRARGEEKGTDFGPDVPDWHDLRDPNVNAQSAAIFQEISSTQIRESAAAVHGVHSAAIDFAVDSVGFESSKADTVKELLKRRRLKVVEFARAETRSRISMRNAPAGALGISNPSAVSLPHGGRERVSSTLPNFSSAAETRGIHASTASGSRPQGNPYPQPSPQSLEKWAKSFNDARAYISSQTWERRRRLLGEAKTFVESVHITPDGNSGSAQQNAQKYAELYAGIVNVVAHTVAANPRDAKAGLRMSQQLAEELGTGKSTRRSAPPRSGAAATTSASGGLGNASSSLLAPAQRRAPGGVAGYGGDEAVAVVGGDGDGDRGVGGSDLAAGPHVPVSGPALEIDDPWLNEWAASRNWAIGFAVRRFVEASGVVNRALGYVPSIGREPAEVEYRDRLRRVVAAVAVTREEAAATAVGGEMDQTAALAVDSALIEHLSAVATALAEYNWAIYRARTNPSSDHTSWISDMESMVEDASIDARNFIPGLDPADVHHVLRYRFQRTVPAGGSVHLPGEPHPARPVPSHTQGFPGGEPALSQASAPSATGLRTQTAEAEDTSATATEDVTGSSAASDAVPVMADAGPAVPPGTATSAPTVGTHVSSSPGDDGPAGSGSTAAARERRAERPPAQTTEAAADETWANQPDSVSASVAASMAGDGPVLSRDVTGGGDQAAADAAEGVVSSSHEERDKWRERLYPAPDRSADVAGSSGQTRHSPGRDYEPTGQPAVVPPTASTRGGVTDLPVSQRSFAPNDPWLNAWAASRNWTIDIAITRFTEASGIVNRALGYVAVIGQESAEVKYRDRLHRVVAAVAVARAEAPTSATGKETEHDSTSEYDAALIERLTAITTALDGYNQAIRQAVQDPAADHTHHISDRQSAVEEASNNAQDLIPGLDPGDVHHLYRYQTQQNLPAGASVYLPGEPHPTRPVAPRALVSPGSVPAGELTHRRHEVKPLAPDKSAFDKLHDVWRGAGASVQRWTGAGRNSVRSALAKAWAQKAPVVKSFDAEPSLTRDVQPRSGHDQYDGAVPWHRRLIGKADLNQVPADISIPRTVRLRFALHPEGRIPVTELGLQHEQLDKWFPGGTDPLTSTTPPAPPRGGSASTQTSSVVPEGQGQPTTGIAVDGARPKALGADTRATAENRPVVGTERGSALRDGAVHLGSEKPHDEWDKFAAENPEKSRHVLAALSGIFTRQGMSGEEWDDTAKRAYGALPAAVRNRNSRDVAQAIFNQMAHGTPYPMIGAGYSIDEIDDLVAEHVAHLRASNFDRKQVPQDTEVFLQFIESDAGQDNAIRPDHAREVMRVVEGVKVRHDSLISPELLSRYSALSPQRAQYVERQPLGRAGLLDEDGPFYYLVASARTPDGQLPEGAAASWDTLSGGTVDRVVQGIEENAGITVHGIEDEALRLLVDRRRFDYPELLAYLSRPDNSRHDDMQPFMAPHEFIYRDVRVIFHFDPHSRPKMNSGEDIIDALNHGIQQQDLHSQIPAQPNWSVNGREFLTTRALLFFLRMIDGLDAGGLSIPDTIDVYAPLYGAHMDVYPVMDDHGILVDLRVERIGTWNLEETAALYCDPGALIITPSATIQYRPYDPRYLSTSTHDFSFVTGLHEGLHWIAARTNRGANMDIFATRFRQEFVRDALMVSEYAASDPAEFIAEYGTATLLGRDFGDASARLERMYLALGGPRIENVLRSHLSEDEISQLLAGVNHILSERGVPAVDQATIAHFYDGLSQYDAWAHPDVLEELIAEDVESMYNNVRGLASPSGWQFTISQPDEPSGMAEGSPLSDHTASDARPHVPRLLIGGGLPESSLDSPWESTDKQLLSPLSPGLFGEAAPPPWARNDAPVSSSPRIGGVPVTAVSPVSPRHAPDKLPMSPGTPRTPRTPRLATNSPRAHDGAQWRGSPRIGRIAETSVSPASPRHAPDKLPMPPGTPRTPKTPRLDTGSPRIVRMADTSDSMRRGLAAIAEEDPRFRGYLRQWRPDSPQHPQPQPDGEKATGAPTRPAAASTQPTATPPTHHDTGARGLETVNLPPAAEALFTMNSGAGPLGNSEGWWLGDKSEAVTMPRSENAAPGASENRRGRLPADTSGLPVSVADSGAAAYDLADVSMAPGEGGDLPPLRLEYIRAVEQDLKAYMELATFEGVSSEDTARGLHAMRRAIGVKYKNLTPEEKRAEIFERNLRKYGDPLGPSVEWLRKRGKSWEEISDSAVRTGGEDLGLGKTRLGPTGDADDGAGGGISEEFTGPQSRDAVVAPPEAETLVAELPRMPHSERVGALEGLTPGQRRWLSRSVRFVAALQREVSSEEMAWTAAHLLVHGDLRADEPASARAEARAQVARMLQNPKVAGRLLNGRAEVLITPRDVHVTDLHALRHLRGKRAGDGRSLDTIRGVSAHGVSAVTEENLLGGETFVGGGHHYPDGFSTATHEIAHAIFDVGLLPADKQVVGDVYHAMRDRGMGAQWPDGSRTDGDGREADNYSSTSVEEFFAQLSNAWLGTNHGTDPQTGQRRNNGAAWVRTYVPALVPLLETLYGSDPAAIHSTPANPVNATRADEEKYAALRDFTVLVETSLAGNDHGQGSPSEPQTLPDPPLQHKTERADPWPVDDLSVESRDDQSRPGEGVHALEAPPPKRPSLRGDETLAGHGWAAPAGSSSGTHRGFPTGPDDTDGAAGSSSGQSTPSSVGLSGAGRRPAATTSQAAAPAIRETAAQDPAATPAQTELTMAQRWQSRLNPEATRPDHNQVSRKTAAETRATTRMEDKPSERTMDQEAAQPRRAGNKHTAKSAAAPHTQTDTSGNASSEIADQDKDGGSPLRRPR